MARVARSLVVLVVLAGCKPDVRAADFVPPQPSTAPDLPLPVVRGPGDVPNARPPDGVEIVIGLVDPAKLRASVDRLAGFGTRHTLSDTASEVRGIGAARRWIESEMKAAAVDPEAPHP